MKKIFASLSILASLLVGTVAAFAYPDRPVRLVVPFPAGGVTDLAARLVGQSLSIKWGQPVVIENRPGAGGLLGVEQVLKSEPDGYTILMSTNGELVIHPAASAKPRFDPLSDLIPITMATITSYAWVANNGSGIKSLKEMVDQAKAKPEHLSYPSAGIGSTMHMAAEQFNAAAGVKMLHVPYKGGAPAASALTSGQVAVGLVPLSSLKPVKDSGQVTLLAVTSAKRIAMLPDVPTVDETGVLKSFEAAIWTALLAPKGTPKDIVAKIQADALEALKDPTLLERLAAVGTDVSPVAGEALRSRIAGEIKQVSEVAKSAGVVLP